MSAPCGVLVLGWSGATGSSGTRAWRNVCSAVGRGGGGGTEGCGSGWFHGRRKDVALDVGRVGFPGAPLEQNAGVD